MNETVTKFKTKTRIYVSLNNTPLFSLSLNEPDRDKKINALLELKGLGSLI